MRARSVASRTDHPHVPDRVSTASGDRNDVIKLRLPTTTLPRHPATTQRARHTRLQNPRHLGDGQIAIRHPQTPEMVSMASTSAVVNQPTLSLLLLIELSAVTPRTASFRARKGILALRREGLSALDTRLRHPGRVARNTPFLVVNLPLLSHMLGVI